jgi:hypothetical protein
MDDLALGGFAALAAAREAILPRRAIGSSGRDTVPDAPAENAAARARPFHG